MKDVTPEELDTAIRLIRAGKSPLRLTTAQEVLDACKLGVVDKKEARSLLGLKKRRQPRQLRRPKVVRA